MNKEIKVPSMGESITEATIGEIFKPSGSYVQIDDEILEIETDKATQALYAPDTGTINLTVNTDDVVNIGQVIGDVQPGAAKDADTKKQVEKTPTIEVEKEPVTEEKKEEPQKQAVQKETPSVRVSKEDFIKELEGDIKPPPEKAPAVEATPVAPEKPLEEKRTTRKRMSRLRQVIAARLVEVKNQTAMLTTFNEVDLSKVMQLRKKHQEKFVKEHGVKLGFMSFFIKAAVSALKACPEINAYIDGQEIVYHHDFDIGVAVGTDKGLVVPVVQHCDLLSFAQIEKKIVELAKKARDGSIEVKDLQGAGFTITNGGVYGSLLSTPILNPPQSGILGMHAIQKRPVVVDEQIVIRPMMYVALSYDHRIVDGKEAVTFLVHIKNMLEDPASLLLEH